MKVFLKDLLNIADEKVYPVNIDYLNVEDNIYLRALKNVTGDITFYYNDNELRINYELKGQMVCPCAITLEDVDVEFDVAEDEKVISSQEEDGFFLENGLELEKLALYIILPEVPIKVVKNEKIEYSRGDGWSFVSEEDYESSREDEIDPRLQKLKEYKFEEDD